MVAFLSRIRVKLIHIVVLSGPEDFDYVIRIKIKWYHLNIFTWVIYITSFNKLFSLWKKIKRETALTFQSKNNKGINRSFRIHFPLTDKRGTGLSFNSDSGVTVKLPIDIEAG